LLVVLFNKFNTFFNYTDFLKICSS